MLAKFFAPQEGQTLAEYALLIALIALVCVAAVTALGLVLPPFFTSVAGSL